MRIFNFQFSIFKRKGNACGFTLIEMIVAVGVFTTAMLISVGATLSISAAQKRAIAIQNVQDNIRFAVETMTKEMRTGLSYHCNFSVGVITEPRDCRSGASSFVFMNARGRTIVYRLIAGQILRSDDGGGSFFPITSKNVAVDRLFFYVLGSESGDSQQPRVTITAQGRANVKNESILLDLQTTMSQRLLDS